MEWGLRQARTMPTLRSYRYEMDPLLSCGSLVCSENLTAVLQGSVPFIMITDGFPTFCCTNAWHEKQSIEYIHLDLRNVQRTDEDVLVRGTTRSTERAHRETTTTATGNEAGTSQISYLASHVSFWENHTARNSYKKEYSG